MKRVRFNLLSVLIVFFGFLILFTLPAMSAEGDYDGAYSGTFTGGDNGTWVAIVSGTSLQFFTWSNLHSSVDGGEFYLNNSGGFHDDTDLERVHITGTVSGNTMSGTWVDEPEGGAFSGVKSTQVSQYASFYSGTYTNNVDLDGTWSLTIMDSGYLVGAIVIENRTLPIKGGVNDSGVVIAYEDNEMIGMKGTIVGSSLSGNWGDADDANKGTFTSAGSSPGSDSESSEGGCFVKSLF